MKILNTGAKGMLADSVRKKFSESPDHHIILTDVSGGDIVRNGVKELETLPLDITDLAAVRALINAEQPDLVINCAAYTAVDLAETNEALALKVNADGPGNLALACAELGQNVTWSGAAGGPVLVHISTDYVFGGAKPVTEEYLEDDPKAPETAYGRTKLAGEQKITANGCNYYIFRTAWLYGLAGKNFVETMLNLAQSSLEPPTVEKATVEVVNDQHGSPTYVEDLTSIIYQAVTRHIPYGIYNATNLGFTTWAGFTEAIFKLSGLDCQVKGISSAEYEEKALKRAAEKGNTDYKVAKRPLNSKMSKQKLLAAGVEIPTWEAGLDHYLTTRKEQNEK